MKLLSYLWPFSVAAATAEAIVVNPFKAGNLYKPVLNGVVTGSVVDAGVLFSKPTVVFVVRRPG